MTFNPASNASVIAFLAVVGFVVGFYFVVIWSATSRLGGDAGKSVIAPVCVGGALAGHVILTRALLRNRTS